MQVVPQQHTPQRRTGHTTTVTIGGERIDLTANADTRGNLCEVIIRWGKQGSARAGLMDLYATALTIGLQNGVPLLDLVAQGQSLCFSPNGPTDDPDLPEVRSIIDWVVRRLALDWLPRDQRAATGVHAAAERAHPSLSQAPAPDLDGSLTPPSALALDAAEFEAFLADLSTGPGSHR
jgi:ribonucleoside-diphosphate reductase alpha chain